MTNDSSVSNQLNNSKKMSENKITEKPIAPLWARVFWDCCWLWAVVGIIVATARVLAHDSHLVWVLANCQSSTLYGLAALVLPLAVWRSRRKLACVSALLFVAQIVWVWPDFMPAQQIQVAKNTPVLRVFSANLYMENKSPAGIVEEINSSDPDVVLLQEFSSLWKQTLSDSGLLEKYPHTILHSRKDSFGVAVLSKRPFLDSETWFVGEVPIISFRIQWQGQSIKIHNWHPLPPRSLEYYEIWNEQYETLLQRLSQETGPSLLVGDFNATQHTLWMKRLLRNGYLGPCANGTWLRRDLPQRHQPSAAHAT